MTKTKGRGMGPGRVGVLGLLALLALPCCGGRPAAEGAALAPRWPAALVPGDTVAIVAPASPTEREGVLATRARLQAMGFAVRMRDDVFRADGYLAGSDAARADELMAAFRDPEVRAIFCATGGYGSMRILDRLDYAEIARHPKILLGFSDITGLHLALDRWSGLVTFHGPLASYGLTRGEGLDPLSERALWWLLAGAGPDGSEAPPAFDRESMPSLRAVAPGRARGRLVGGNLSLVSALAGTPYAAKAAGRILFLEDVRERPYRVDRMLVQLRLSGDLDGLAGVLLGHFTKCDPRDGEASATVEQVLEDFFAGLGVPVLAGFAAGHAHPNVALPIGGEVELDADRLTLRILDGRG